MTTQSCLPCFRQPNLTRCIETESFIVPDDVQI